MIAVDAAELLVAYGAYALRASVVVVAAAAASRLLRRASPAARHASWASAMCIVLMMPLVGRFVPGWQVRVESELVDRALRVIPAVSEDGASKRAADAFARPDHRAEPAVVSASRTPAIEPTSGGAAMSASRAATRGADLMFLLWIGGVIAALIRLGIGAARVRALGAAAAPIESASLLAEIRRTSDELGISRRVRALVSSECQVPVTWGFLRPVLLLPSDAMLWSADRRRAVLLHELAHVARFDSLTQLVAHTAVALHWFNPLMWVATNRMRVERERACDSEVISRGARPTSYANDLLDFARRLRADPAPVAALAMARRTELEGRLMAILDRSWQETPRGPRPRAVAWAIVLFGLPAGLLTIEPAPAAARPQMPPAPIAPLPPEPISFLSDAPRGSEQPLIEDARVAAPRNDHARVAFPPEPDTIPPRTADLATLVEVTRASGRMSSDYEKGQLLALVARRFVRSDVLRDSYVAAVATMKSDYERATALLAFLRADTAAGSIDHQLAVLAAAEDIGSSYEKANVLVRFAATRGLAEPRVRQAYVRAAGTLDSDYEYRRAMAAAVR